MSLVGRLIHGRNTTMIDLETMIKGSDKMLLISWLDDGAASTYKCKLAGVERLIDGRDTALLLSSGQLFG
jgi:hypothetical protein